MLVPGDIPALDAAIGVLCLYLILIAASAGIALAVSMYGFGRYGPHGYYGPLDEFEKPDYDAPPDSRRAYEMRLRIGHLARSRVYVFIIVALVLVIATNANTLTVVERAWTHDASEQAALSGVQRETTRPTPAASAKEIDDVEELGLPVGWSDANTPHNGEHIIETVAGLLVTWVIVIALPIYGFGLLTADERMRLKRADTRGEIGPGRPGN